MMEFHASHHTALALAGTVPLPSPFPASGPVSLVVTRDGEDYEVFVKILQVVGDKRIITRFVRPEDVRAIRGKPEGAAGGGPESWPVLGIRKIQGEIDRRANALIETARKTGVLDEAPWYVAAIVHVAESAPVLHRNEVGVTAAVSCEDVGFTIDDRWTGCCHDDTPPFPLGSSHCCHVAGPLHAPGCRPGKDHP